MAQDVVSEAGDPVEQAADDARRQAEALAALAAAVAALDRFVAGYAFVSTSQEMMVRAMVGTLRGMMASADRLNLS